MTALEAIYEMYLLPSFLKIAPFLKKFLFHPSFSLFLILKLYLDMFFCHEDHKKIFMLDNTIWPIHPTEKQSQHNSK